MFENLDVRHVHSYKPRNLCACPFSLLHDDAKLVDILKDDEFIGKFLEHPCGDILGSCREINKDSLELA